VAENRAGAFTLTPYFGGQGFPFGGDTHYDADYNYGLRAGYNFTPHWGTEFVFGLNRTVHDPEAEYCNIYQYGADVLYFFQPEKKVVPFFAAGFGVLDVKFYGAYDGTPPAGTQLNSDETNPYFNYGGGVEFQITSRLGFRADFRDAIMLNSGDHAMQGGIGLRFQF
jgi:OOP family OmpA-OmpF porin